MPTIIHGITVISTSFDKAKLITVNFASSSKQDNQDDPLPDFPSVTEHKLCDHSILAEVSRSFKNLDFTMATGRVYIISL